MASIEKRGENTYRITVSAGYDSKGKKLRKHKAVTLDPKLTPKQTEKELQRLATLFEEEVNRGTYLDGSKITFAEFTERWLTSYAEKELEPKTVFRYKELLTLRIIPALGHIKLEKLQPTHLIDFYNNLKEVGIRLDNKYIINPDSIPLFKDIKALSAASKVDIRTIRKFISGGTTTSKVAHSIGKALEAKLEDIFIPLDQDKGLADRTILHHHRVISSILTAAVQWQLILSNPAERIKSPKVGKTKIHYYNADQTKELLKALESEEFKYKVMVLLDVFTGLRLGELMGLHWKNINFDNKTIEINSANQYLTSKGNFDKKTKTESSNRVISIPAPVSTLLKEYRKWWLEQKVKCGEMWQKEEKEIQGDKYVDPERLFVTWDGKPMFTYTLTAWFPKFLERHNLPKISPHGLRHTSATLLESQGLNISAISKRLGHSRTSTTMDIYVHALKDADTVASDLLEKTLFEVKSNEEAK